VIDQKGREKDDQPADEVQALQKHTANSMLNVPDYSWHGEPLPTEQQEQQACEQYKGAALDRWWNDHCPPPFEGWSSHNTMLDGEEAKQQYINDKRVHERD